LADTQTTDTLTYRDKTEFCRLKDRDRKNGGGKEGSRKGRGGKEGNRKGRRGKEGRREEWHVMREDMPWILFLALSAGRSLQGIW